jgi:hypothetical protein
LTDPDHDAHAAFAQFSYIPVIVITTHMKRVVTFPAPGYPLLIRPLPSPPVDTSIVNLRASLLDLEHDEHSMDHAPWPSLLCTTKQLWCVAQQNKEKR